MSAQPKRGRPRQEIRNGHKWCAYHKAWERIKQFDVKNATGTLETSCKVARVAMRDAGKETPDASDFWGTGTGIDPDLHVRAETFVGNRASEVVKRLRYLGIAVNRQWVLIELNYVSLIAPVRALLGPDGLCQWCGLPFTKTQRLSLDHIEPPRWDGYADWERLHARNVQIGHFGENSSKGGKGFAVFLHDDQDKWMAERCWSRHAGEKGWPSLEAMRLPPPGPEPGLEPEVDLRMTIFDFLDEGAA